MNVLSLYDGMSCGMIAFRQLGIPVDEYHAYEIDKYAVQVSQHNFPEIIHHGDVFDGDFTAYKSCDWLIGGSPCFTAGHLVLTDKGYKDISEIQIGDMVLTHMNRYRPVTRLYQHQSETVKLKIMGYPEFTVTENHPFLTKTRTKVNEAVYKETHSWRKFGESEWTKVGEMTKNTFCSMHLSEPNIFPSNLENEILWLLGRYIADGHVRKDKRKDRKDSYQYQLIISVGENKLSEFKEKMQGYHFSCYPHTDSVYRCVFSSKQLVNFILDNEFGRSAVDKKIPESFMHLPAEQAKIFLEGYMSGDGNYVESAAEYNAATVSKTLAFQLQKLIARIYQTNVSISVSRNDRKHFINGREIRANHLLYTVKYKKGLRKQSVAHIEDEKVWTAFKSMTKTGLAETVYNIEVEEDHSYTVNNCIVHNCTYWSIAQSPGKREKTASGIGWELFQQYVRALHEAEPEYFLYENNYSMSATIRDSISESFGFEPIMINSALVSAQSRKRLYWVGASNHDGTYSKCRIRQPKDRKIFLKDVIDGVAMQDKAYTVTATEYKDSSLQHSINRHIRTRVAMPVNADSEGKSRTIKAQYSNTSIANLVRDDHLGASGEAIRIGHIGKGGQAERIYSVCGKSVTLKGNGGGGGGKTGLYKIDLPDGDYIIRKLTVSECMRLQTVPDWYDFSVISNTQAYKCLGNGWTVEVIMHLISQAMQGKTEESYIQLGLF